MDKQANDIAQPFMEVVTNKFEKQDEKIAQLDERMKHLPAHSEEFGQLKRDLIEIKAIVSKISFPAKEMLELSANLETSVQLLKQPVQDKVLHHHEIPKLLWIAFGLLFLTCFFVVLWFSTMKNLSQYKANDTKYRFLKLQNNKNLHQLLYATDSLYLVDRRMRDSVIQKEEQKARNLERLEKAMELEQEAKDLRDKATDK